MEFVDEYTNEGKGIVLDNSSTAGILATMFDKKPFWTSAELNDALGWQFSQAVYNLRRQGLKIITRRLGARKFGYELIPNEVA